MTKVATTIRTVVASIEVSLLVRYPPKKCRVTLRSAATTPGPRPIEVSATGGDVERIEVPAAEAAFVRKIGRDRVGFEHCARGREHVDQRAWAAALPSADGDDVAVGIETHALDAAVVAAMIGAEAVQHDRVIDGAVVADRIGAQLPFVTLARLAIRHVQGLLVRRQQHRARGDRVEGDTRGDPGAAIVALEPEHRAVLEERKDGRAERNRRMARIGELD